ncbi:hypothetical protein [Halobellus salinus]|uniref:hypothetical protein n=1 Tax=Halobellus salinus TaxID=931585 RepID=UPI00166A0E18|nr:hypothetical protein [Halobellus salinus]
MSVVVPRRCRRGQRSADNAAVWDLRALSVERLPGPRQQRSRRNGRARTSGERANDTRTERADATAD